MNAPDALPPLLEREASLLALRQAVELAQRGTGGTVLVSGEPGIGKSSLLRQWVGSLDHRQRAFWGGCEDLFSPRPLGPLRDIALVQRGPLLALIDSDASGASLFAAFFDLLNTSVTTSVVVFEDVHWADEATLDLVRFLARRIERLPVVLALSYRDSEVATGHPLGLVLGDLPARSVTRLALQPLSPEAVAAMAQRLGRPSSGLHAATGGNPFYVTEVLGSDESEARGGGPLRCLHRCLRPCPHPFAMRCSRAWRGSPPTSAKC